MIFPFGFSCSLTAPMLEAARAKSLVRRVALIRVVFSRPVQLLSFCLLCDFVSQSHLASFATMRLRHLYYRADNHRVSKWNCDISDISSRWERSNIPASCRASSRGSTGAFPPDSGVGGRDRFQTLRATSTRRKDQRGRQIVSQGCPPDS